MRILAGFILSLLLTACAHAEEITIAAAANLQYTLKELVIAFEKQERTAKVIVVLGSSGKLASQIENGAPFDIFMSADLEMPRMIEKEGLSFGQANVYAVGTLVLWTMDPRLNLSKGMALLKEEGIEKIAIANPQVAPYGRQAMHAIRYYGMENAIRHKLVRGESIGQVDQFITTKSVSIGFTAKSIVLSDEMKNKGQWIDVDLKAYEPIAQAVVMLKNGTGHRATAVKFFGFLFSPTAREIFKKYGYRLT